MAAPRSITYERIDVCNVLKLEDSMRWLKKEVHGKLVLIGDEFQHFKEPAVKCVIGSGNYAVTVMIHKHEMVHAIASVTRDRNIGLSVAHFQKKQGALFCSKFSVIELLVEGVPDYTAEGSNDETLLYAPMMTYRDIMTATQNTMLSVKGVLYKFYAKPHNGPTKVDIQNSYSETLRVTLWGDGYDEILSHARTGQEITFYDMRANVEREKDYLGTALAAVVSSSSTKIVLDNVAHDIPTLSIEDLLLETGNHLMECKVVGTLVAVTPICRYKNKEYMKVVIAEQNHGILVVVRKPDLFPMLSLKMINKAKLTISRFRMDGSCINTDECTEIAYDTEDLPTVQGEFSHLLHAKVEDDYSAMVVKAEGTVVSVKGAVIQVYNDERKATVVLQDGAGKTVYTYLWDDKKEEASNLCNGDDVIMYDVRIKRSGDAVILTNSSATEVKNVTGEGGITELSGTLTGFNADFIYIRDKDTKHCLKASPDVKKCMHEYITSPVKVTAEGKMAVAIAKRKLDMD